MGWVVVGGVEERWRGKEEEEGDDVRRSWETETLRASPGEVIL